MSKLNNGEPSLDKIDDYNGNESKQKRNTVRVVIIFCLVVGALVAYFKATSVPDDYIGSKEQPGISTTK
jgi:hypothetical protein